MPVTEPILSMLGEAQYPGRIVASVAKILRERHPLRELDRGLPGPYEIVLLLLKRKSHFPNIDPIIWDSFQNNLSWMLRLEFLGWYASVFFFL